MSASAVAKPTLTTPITVGRLSLTHRVVLPPLTRVRSDPATLAPNAMMAEHYKQRATKGGLLISEATYISPETIGTNFAPGIWSPEQIAGWKLVTDAVHSKGGYIYCQLWHIGRIAHASFNEHHLVKGSGYQVNRSASDIPQEGETNTTLDGSMQPHVKPVPFTIEDIARLRKDYVHAAKNAIEAGFDGVELHGAHGYLIDQFLNSGTNIRTDAYGGSALNRCRLLNEVLGDLCAAVGNDRVALRLSPHVNKPPMFFGITCKNAVATYKTAFATAATHKLAYLLVTESRWIPSASDSDNNALMQQPCAASLIFKSAYAKDATPESVEVESDDEAISKATAENAAATAAAMAGLQLAGPVIGAGGFTPVSAAAAVNDRVYDLIGVGRYFISNPDLPYRITKGLPLNTYVREKFYGQTADGYTDYPTFAEVCAELGVSEADYLPQAEGEAAETEEAKAERLAKIEALVELSKTKGVKYPLISAQSIGVSTSSATRK